MNEHVRQLLPATTQAAEGMPRRAWTVDDVKAMVKAGILDETERVELIGGELVPMSAKGAFHEDVKRALSRHWYNALPPEWDGLTETTLWHAPRDFREPDFIFWPSSVPVRDLAPAHVQLLVEIADSSLDYDLGTKAAYYAGLGIPDYWVIDARRLVTRIHRAPGNGAWASVAEHAATVMLEPLIIPALAVRLADLGLEPADSDQPV